MIFSKPKLSFRILEVLKIENENVHMTNQKRHFGAISYRIHSDAVIEYGGKRLEMCDRSVSYFPPDVDYVRTAGIDEIYVVHVSVIGYSTKEIETYVTENPEKTEAAFKAIYEEWQKNQPNASYRVSAMFYDLFDSLFLECRETSGESPYFTQAQAYISAHYHEPSLSVSEIAGSLSVSEVYLRKIFRKEAGVSPRSFLAQFRIRRAETLLLSNYYTVKEVANAVGFEDEKYFSVVFREKTGIVPSEYRYKFKGSMQQGIV